jgi:hypothetical protein
VSPSGLTYIGNWGLDTDQWSNACTVQNPCPLNLGDTVNTVENIFIQNPPSGAWTVKVRAVEINGDGHTETPTVDDVDFALVVSLEHPRCPETDVLTFCAPCAGDVDCCDANVCTFNDCAGTRAECTYFPMEYGNVDGSANQTPNLDDLLCLLDGFSAYANCPNADLHPPCTGDGDIDIDDQLALIDAFGGFDPCGCEP